ncbi:hypothetical protein GWG54_20475 [Natronococcus sp. JC468]|uniref:hypothetical protein n=1 Tax=Natronococcus sp. JC468 TaxID=1961921 RepID=UPI00143BE5B9|nr:hypothetical protein [Natronococcus sp. JC468]NKE38108.1 hypothetical protein [Natronococcus sp. JC468]
MPTDTGSTQEYTFSTPVDLLSTLEALNIQYLDIDEIRTLVIYQTAILNLVVLDGELSAASRVELEVYEDPRQDFSLESDEKEKTVLASFLDQLVSENRR